jgi:hypothetical protein
MDDATKRAALEAAQGAKDINEGKGFAVKDVPTKELGTGDASRPDIGKTINAPEPETKK